MGVHGPCITQYVESCCRAAAGGEGKSTPQLLCPRTGTVEVDCFDFDHGVSYFQWTVRALMYIIKLSQAYEIVFRIPVVHQDSKS